MANLKNKIILILSFSLLFSCQSKKVFEIKTQNNGGGLSDLQTVIVNSNRIIHECYFLNAESENKWRHQYFMYILDDQNRVVSVMNPTNQGDEECLDHLKKVEKILKKSEKVKMCLRDELIKDNSSLELHDFGKLGKHADFYDTLYFDSICNAKECFSINETWTNTCSGFKKNTRVN